jgi:hypothetical protein
MNERPQSDAELHEMIMARQAARSREAWQVLIDETNEVFDRQEAAERAYTHNGSHAESKAIPKRSHKKVEVLAD